MPVLHDGREVASDSLEWRDECLARHVLRLPDRRAMEQWLADFAQQNGAAAEGTLRAKLNALRAADKSRQVPTKTVTSRRRK